MNKTVEVQQLVDKIELTISTLSAKIAHCSPWYVDHLEGQKYALEIVLDELKKDKN